jgi:hypothetical protein
MTDTLNRLIKKLLMSRVTLNLVFSNESASLRTSVPLSETDPSSGGRFVDVSTAYFSAACNFGASATQVGP